MLATGDYFRCKTGNSQILINNYIIYDYVLVVSGINVYHCRHKKNAYHCSKIHFR
jgi:hypothetical protein